MATGAMTYVFVRLSSYVSSFKRRGACLQSFGLAQIPPSLRTSLVSNRNGTTENSAEQTRACSKQWLAAVHPLCLEEVHEQH